MLQKIVFFLTISTLFLYAKEEVTEKERELTKLELVKAGSYTRIDKASSVRAGEVITRLLPTFSVSKRATAEDFEEKEYYYSVSIPLSNAFDVYNKTEARTKEKRIARRKVESICSSIYRYIEKKYMMIEQKERYEIVASAIKEPDKYIEAEQKIYAMKLQIQDIEIKIIDLYAEIEFIITSVEN